MVDMRDYKDRERGAQALRLFDDPMFQEAINGVKDSLFADFKQTAPNEQDAREDIYRMFNLVDGIVKYLGKVIDDGSMASHKITQDEAKETNG